MGAILEAAYHSHHLRFFPVKASIQNTIDEIHLKLLQPQFWNPASTCGPKEIRFNVTPIKER